MGGEGSGSDKLKAWSIEQELKFLQGLGNHASLSNTRVRKMSRLDLFNGYVKGLVRRTDSTFTVTEIATLRVQAEAIRDHGMIRTRH